MAVRRFCPRNLSPILEVPFCGCPALIRGWTEADACHMQGNASKKPGKGPFGGVYDVAPRITCGIFSLALASLTYPSSPAIARHGGCGRFGRYFGGYGVSLLSIQTKRKGR